MVGCSTFQQFVNRVMGKLIDRIDSILNSFAYKLIIFVSKYNINVCTLWLSPEEAGELQSFYQETLAPE